MRFLITIPYGVHNSGFLDIVQNVFWDVRKEFHSEGSSWGWFTHAEGQLQQWDSCNLTDELGVKVLEEIKLNLRKIGIYNYRVELNPPSLVSRRGWMEGDNFEVDS